MSDVTKRPCAGTALSLVFAGLLAVSGGPAAAQAPTLATVTILDGAAVLLRGAVTMQVAEGVRLVSQDVVETAADTRLVRLEFADGLALSLGPATRLLIDPRLLGERGRAARVYLLRGWVKLNAAPPAAGAKPAASVALLASPSIDLLSAAGGVVAAVQDGSVQVFVEAGDVALQERDVFTPVGSVQKLHSGDFFVRQGSARAAVTPRPAPAFLKQLPRSFMDTLPTRAAIFKDRDTAPKKLSDIAYADVKDWMAAEPALRKASMNRWRPMTKNPAFRSALVANMPAHPEWDRVLFPEKYLPKPAHPAPVAGAAVPLR